MSTLEYKVRTYRGTPRHSCLAVHKDLAALIKCKFDEMYSPLKMRQQVGLLHVWHVNEHVRHGQLLNAGGQVWHIIDNTLQPVNKNGTWQRDPTQLKALKVRSICDHVIVQLAMVGRTKM